MFKKVLGLLAFGMLLTSCQFTETMVLQEDGTGEMRLSLDLSEIMAMSGEFGKDSTMVKKDTIISFKDILEERKDSIATLPKAEQERLMTMENYNIQIQMDPEVNNMVMDVFVNFKNVNEANDLMKSFEMTEGMIPGQSANKSSEDQKKDDDVIAVRYNFENGTFTRDAYIKDEALYKQQLDSMQQAESFMSGIRYRLKYTFPRRIKSTSVDDATFSLDGKTVELERGFLEYFKNPDVLDLEVVLEK